MKTMNQASLMFHLASGRPPPGRAILVAAFGLALSCAPAWSQGGIDEDADGILRAMTDYLKSLKAFSTDYDSDYEIVDKQGQKLQYSASGTITASRDAGFLMTRKGPYADTQLTFDGKTISLYGKALNVYAQIDSPGPSIDQAVQEFRMSTGLDAPGADLLSADPYAVLTEGVVSGSLVGDAYLAGVECDHLAFRTEAVDWQIWITKGEKPLPMKYVITTKWVTGAPQYSLRLSNWKIGDIEAGMFPFTPPGDAKKLDGIYSDEIGELTLERSE
jgi:hypothetical protein